eukprot:181643_1
MTLTNTTASHYCIVRWITFIFIFGGYIILQLYSYCLANYHMLMLVLPNQLIPSLNHVLLMDPNLTSLNHSIPIPPQHTTNSSIHSLNRFIHARPNPTAITNTIQMRLEQDCSCLNQIYDEIFVISTKTRLETLSITLYQLEQEHINYILWQGHSSYNTYSKTLWRQFRYNLDRLNQSRFSGGCGSMYKNRKLFFRRQTQIDILKYAQHHELQKILIFEDDILLANPRWINMFCRLESDLPHWGVLNLGTQEMRHQGPLFTVTNHTNNPIKYYYQKDSSFGTFAISFAHHMYSFFIDHLDNIDAPNNIPLDCVATRINQKRMGMFSIYPNLVLHDATASTLRDSPHKHYSKYWNLRYETQSIPNITSDDERLYKLFDNSPSQTYLRKPDPDCSCLNQIYDEIFVISIKSRLETLSITLYQLHQENIRYILWQGHSSYNTHSVTLWKQFRHNIDRLNQSRYSAGFGSMYKHQNLFFMRRTQIDILKYAQQHKLPKILIFEDDILLANPRWINMFCEVEADLPEWGVLNLGTQEGYPTFQTRSKNQIKITNHSDSPMRYCYKMDASFGTFAISFAYHMYSFFIGYLDAVDAPNNVPLDCLARRINEVGRVGSNGYRNRSYVRVQRRKVMLNIHPNLVLPDVTTSTLREASHKMSTKNEEMKEYIKLKTTDRDVQHYSKYWDLRFADANETQFIPNITIDHEWLHELFANSPSQAYLKK